MPIVFVRDLAIIRAHPSARGLARVGQLKSPKTWRVRDRRAVFSRCRVCQGVFSERSRTLLRRQTRVITSQAVGLRGSITGARQTQKIKPFPVIMVGKEYWKGILDWIGDTLLREKMIAVEDLDIIHTVDTPEEVLHWVQGSRIRHGIHTATTMPWKEAGGVSRLPFVVINGCLR